jgi:predicted PhzF superfamily epimerase YddE/YHI9
VPRTATVSLVNEQGTKMGRQSFLHIELAYGSDRDIPTSIEVGGSVVPIVSGELSLPEARI